MLQPWVIKTITVVEGNNSRARKGRVNHQIIQASSIHRLFFLIFIFHTFLETYQLHSVSNTNLVMQNYVMISNK